MPRDAAASGLIPAWLTRLSPEEWLRQALTELSRAEARIAAHERSAAVLGLRRAAGMALNGALAVRWRAWGRSYIDHLRAVADDPNVPEAVREAARFLNDVPIDKQPNVVRLTPPSEGARWVEAAKTVMAHAYAIVHGDVGEHREAATALERAAFCQPFGFAFVRERRAASGCSSARRYSAERGASVHAFVAARAETGDGRDTGAERNARAARSRACKPRGHTDCRGCQRRRARARHR